MEVRCETQYGSLVLSVGALVFEGARRSNDCRGEVKATAISGRSCLARDSYRNYFPVMDSVRGVCVLT